MDAYLDGTIEAPLIPLDTINRIPVSMWTGMLDHTCLHSRAKTTRDEIGERVTKF